MKKWVIGLSLVLGISVIGTGVTLGKIYKEEVKTYEQNLEKPLVKEALNNVYINSDVPVNLVTTKGKPYVEFYSKLTGITPVEPEFTIDVKIEGNSSYIDIKESNYFEWSFLMSHNQFATIYLPDQEINELSIKANGRNQNFDIENNVNYLNIDTSSANITLDGDYKIIDIEKGRGTVSINSKSPAEVILKGSGYVELKGNYSLIDIDNNSGDIRINSSNPAEVRVKSGGGNVKILGNYKDVEVEGSYGDIEVKSESVCDLDIYSSGEMKFEGAFNKIDVKSQYGSIDLTNTIQPEKINLLGEYDDMNIVLPENITGFEITNKKQYQEQDELYTDFNIKRGQAGSLIDKIEYGDSKSKIMLEGSNGRIYLLKGTQK